MRPPDALERSQLRLFRSLKNELRLLERSRYVKTYEKAFLASLPARPRASTKAELLRAVKKARIVLVGDFHSFRQSQKGFLRLLRDSRAERAAIGLECVKQSGQAVLDHYLAGHLTVEELKEELDFEHEWPFPWPHYREILEFARVERLPLLALNTDQREREAGLLAARDLAAAERITTFLEDHPSTQLFVLYGELHLARPHLPARLRSLTRARSLVVHQNEPSLYWNAPRSPGGQKPEVLKLRQDEYCVLNSVPWVKLRSHLDWLEGSHEEEDWQDGVDIAGSVQQFARVLAETIGLGCEIPEDIETIGPETLLSRSFSPRNLSPAERTLLRHSLRFQRTSFLPQRGLLLLPSLSTNALTEGASLLLWRAQSQRHAKSAAASGSRLVAQFLVAFLGSKILNPKRKCNEEKDLEAQLGRKIPARKRAVLKRALSLLALYLKNKKVREASKKLAGPLEVEASRLAGYVLANRLFLALQRDSEELVFIRGVYGASNASEAWANHLLRSVSREIRKRRVAPSRKDAGF